MSQFPETVKAITYSKTGDVDVIEKTDQPFPKQGPGDVILKVQAIATSTLQLMVTYPIVTMHVGRVCRCELHRYLLQEWTLSFPPSRDRGD